MSDDLVDLEEILDADDQENKEREVWEEEG